MPTKVAHGRPFLFAFAFDRAIYVDHAGTDMNDIREHAGPLVIAHYPKGKSAPDFYIMGSGVRMIAIDDNVPGDRVYEFTNRAHPRILDELLDASEIIGNDKDGSPAQDKDEVIAKVMADAPVPLPTVKKPRELPSYLRVIK
jgi:hypothetical protein